MKNKHCSWCDNTFETQISYQIYCSVECRELATREKIRERYIATKIKNRAGKNRKCKSCNSALSIYNDDSFCSNCLIIPKDVFQALKDIKKIIKDKDF